MKYFSVPADFKVDTIKKYYELNSKYKNSKVVETYGQITIGDVLSSGRATDALPKADFKIMEKYIRDSIAKGIEFNYTLNSACLGNNEFSKEGIKQIKSLLVNLSNIGVKYLTLSSPSVMELVNSVGLDFNIKASAICEINSPSKAMFYKNIGVKRIVLDPDITRNFRRIQQISRIFGDGVEIIVNNTCYRNCAYKMFHYNHDAHCTPDNSLQTINSYFSFRCAMQKLKHFENFIKLNWVRPEDLALYHDSGINFFKIQGRPNVLRGNSVKVLEHYFNGDYDGNLCDLITMFTPYSIFKPYIDNKKLNGFLDIFYNNLDFCLDNCNECNYCLSYAQKSMNQVITEKENTETLSLYKENDMYTKVINEYD